MKTERKKLIAKLDKIFSEYIRERDDYICITCGVTRNTHVIQCGHLFSRQCHSTRWDELNAYAQCAGCNYRHEFDFEPFRRAWIAKHSQDEYDKLYAKFSGHTKFTNTELEILCCEYKKKLKKLKENV
jgi:hypothetical protein